MSRTATLELGWFITFIGVCVYDYKVQSKPGVDGTEAFRLSQHNHLTFPLTEHCPMSRARATQQQRERTYYQCLNDEFPRRLRRTRYEVRYSTFISSDLLVLY